MPITPVLLVMLVMAVALRLRWGPALRARDAWHRVRPVVRDHIMGSPGTYLYLFAVTITAWVLATSTNHVDNVLLRTHSSNLSGLEDNPLRALVQSAFWVEGVPSYLVALGLGIALAPVERRIGTFRWTWVFALGHMGATLIVAAAIWVGLRTGDVPLGVRHMVDVGSSYGFAAVAGCMTHLLPPRTGRRYSAAVALVLAALVVALRDFPSLGHLVAFGIGVALVPLAVPRRVDAEPMTLDVRPGARALMARLRGTARASGAVSRDPSRW